MTADRRFIALRTVVQSGRHLVARLSGWSSEIVTRRGIGFDLPPHELEQLNRWLLSKTWLTCGVLVFLASLAKTIALPDLPLGWIVTLCGFDVVSTFPLRRWLATRRALGLLVYAQLAINMILLTAGFAMIARLPVLLHMQYLLLIIPCALLSPLCGAVMLVLATAAHLFLLARHPAAIDVVELLVPISFFAVIAQQCVFYGRRYAAKKREAESKSWLAEALLRLSSELGRVATSASVVQRLAELARELTQGAWAGVLMRDVDRGTYKVVGISSRTGEPDEELRSVEFAEASFVGMIVGSAGGRCVELRADDDSGRRPSTSTRSCARSISPFPITGGSPPSPSNGVPRRVASWSRPTGRSSRPSRAISSTTRSSSRTQATCA
jgi:hypothetical protein